MKPRVLRSCLAMTAASLICGVIAAQELSPATYDRLRERIDVTPDELRWQQVSWLSFWDGVVAAQRQDQPIFYWIYFGDPRGGC